MARRTCRELEQTIVDLSVIIVRLKKELSAKATALAVEQFERKQLDNIRVELERELEAATRKPLGTVKAA